VNKKKYYSWILYDWANSAYATVVLAGFFPIIFADYYATEFLEVTRTLLLGIANSSASLLLIVFAPLLGLIADRRNNRKLFLIIFALLGIFSTFILTLIGNDNWALASIFFSISLLGFMLSNVFYDSMLLSFNDKSSYDSISSYGYAFGYLGGGIAFVLSIIFLVVNKGSNIDLIANKKIVFIFASLWWLVFMLPLVFNWTVNAEKVALNKRSLKDSFRDIFNNKVIFYFLIAYWVYIDGVDTIIRMAVNYGLTLGFTPDHLLIALLVTQFIAFPGTLLINKIAHYKTTEFGILFCLIIYLIITFLSYNLTTLTEFFIIAILIGLVQGGIQALSRSYYSTLIPNGRDCEYFGIYNMLGKFAALLGPLVVGMITYISDSTRIGILSLSIFFIIGIFLFLKHKKI
tara:strand:+ start:23 stop:1231 length:1209 start_codon:yes stop_codon:yes gene_type:complete